ncbi:hypothetical protein ACFQ0T_29930 [Kitasatospora gansuensis]
MLAAGAYAVFTRDVEAGPTALITIGAFLVLIGVVGRRITSVELASGQIGWEQREQVKEEVEAARTPEQALTVVDTAATYDPRIRQDPQLVSLARAAYDVVIRNSLTAALPPGATLTPVRDSLADFVVRVQDKSVAVVVKYGDPDSVFDSVRLRRVLEQMANSDFSAVVLVSNMGEPRGRVRQLANERTAAMGKSLAYVQWRDGADDLALWQTVAAQAR